MRLYKGTVGTGYIVLAKGFGAYGSSMGALTVLSSP
jgi:hypothetical protein